MAQWVLRGCCLGSHAETVLWLCHLPHSIFIHGLRVKGYMKGPFNGFDEFCLHVMSFLHVQAKASVHYTPMNMVAYVAIF